ncbi:MAG: hypothetical protein ABI036_20115 [Fibrobacteria bacterium]
MALNGIGGGDAGSALERFQAIRDSAKKKLEGGDGASGLAELIKRKQLELGDGGINNRSAAERIPPRPAAIASAASGATGPGYGRAGGAQKQDSKPTLGRHVDFMA